MRKKREFIFKNDKGEEKKQPKGPFVSNSRVTRARNHDNTAGYTCMRGEAPPKNAK